MSREKCKPLLAKLLEPEIMAGNLLEFLDYFLNVIFHGEDISSSLIELFDLFAAPLRVNRVGVFKLEEDGTFRFKVGLGPDLFRPDDVLDFRFPDKFPELMQKGYLMMPSEGINFDLYCYEPRFGPKIVCAFDDTSTDRTFTPQEISNLRVLTSIVAKVICKRLQESKVLKETQLDPLTKVFNYQATTSKLRRFIKDLVSIENGSLGFTFAMIDLDNFSTINSKLGWTEANQFIHNLIKACKECTRATDVIGKIGGEEFCIILPNANTEIAVSRIRKIREKFSEFSLETCRRIIAKQLSPEDAASMRRKLGKFRFGFSAGIIAIGKDEARKLSKADPQSADALRIDFERVIKLADVGCNYAKAAGKNTEYVWLFDKSIPLHLPYKTEKRQVELGDSSKMEVAKKTSKRRAV